jgi:hypothetical protein
MTIVLLPRNVCCLPTPVSARRPYPNRRRSPWLASRGRPRVPEFTYLWLSIIRLMAWEVNISEQCAGIYSRHGLSRFSSLTTLTTSLANAQPNTKHLPSAISRSPKDRGCSGFLCQLIPLFVPGSWTNGLHFYTKLQIDHSSSSSDPDITIQ